MRIQTHPFSWLGIASTLTRSLVSVTGVPADVLFQGRFASKTTAQCVTLSDQICRLAICIPGLTPSAAFVCSQTRLTLLNTTVAQLAKSVSSVLTMAYRDIYGEDEDGDAPAMLQLLTSPLAATDEVLNLYAGGLAPVELAMPAVLRASFALELDTSPYLYISMTVPL